MLIGLTLLANDYLCRHKSFYAFARWSMVEYARGSFFYGIWITRQYWISIQ